MSALERFRDRAARIAIQQDKNIVVETQAVNTLAEIQFVVLDDFETALAAETSTTAPSKFERSTRETILRMLSTTKLDEIFTFQVAAGTGLSYVRAIRSLITRIREAASRKKRPLERWKLHIVEIRTVEKCDMVSLMRSHRARIKDNENYEAFFDAFSEDEGDD